MLILTRKSGEAVAIGDDITVTVLSIQGKQVKLGITAPDRITVYREEIFERIKKENTKTAPPQKNGGEGQTRRTKNSGGRNDEDSRDTGKKGKR